MKCVLSAMLLLALITGGQAVAGDVGAACSTGDACTDSNAFCDTTDSTNKVCKCNRRWSPSGTACVRGATQPCHDSQCHNSLKCSNGACFCDASKGYDGLGTNGTITCSCPAKQVIRTSDGKCAKVIEQPCTDSSQCIDNAVCESSKCKCDTSKFYGAGAADATSCTCDPAKAVTSGSVCKLKLGQGNCGTVSDCTVETDVSCTSQTCTCDTSKNLAHNTAGTACECAMNYAKKADGTCGKVIGQGCSMATECIDNTVCIGNTAVCTCDTAKNLMAASTACTCKAKYHLKADGTCGKVIGQECTDATQCIDNTVCTGATTKCACDPAKHLTGATDATACTCDPAKASGTAGSCRLLLDQTGCNNAETDCVTGTGVVCSSSKCDCDASKQLVQNTGKTACICDATKATGGAGSCRLNLEKGTCAKDEDCVTGVGVKCVDGTCGCDTSERFSINAGKTACECPTDHTPQAAFDTQPDSCVLKVGAACNCSTAQCVFGTVCDEKTGTCLCDVSNNFKVGTTGATSCSCADDSSSMTIGSRTFCGKKIGGSCLLESASGVCASGMTCKSKTISGNTVYGCQCTSGTDNICDGTCGSGADNLTVSIVMLMVGLMTSALVRFLK